MENNTSKLRELRKKRRFTVEECCDAVGVSPSAWRMYETGARVPRDEVKKKIAAFFDRTVQFIFFDD